MRKLLGLILAFVFAAQVVHADTYNTLPTSNSSFLSTLTTFLTNEDANRAAAWQYPFVVSGGTHATGAGLTKTPTALVAFPNGVYVTDTGSVTYTLSSTCWVIANSATTGNVTTFTRSSGTHYLVDCATGATQPARPSGTVWLMKVVTNTNSVTAVTDLRTMTPVLYYGSTTTDFPTAAVKGRRAVAVSTGFIYTDSGSSWVQDPNNLAVDVTSTITAGNILYGVTGTNKIGSENALSYDPTNNILKLLAGVQQVTGYIGLSEASVGVFTPVSIFEIRSDGSVTSAFGQLSTNGGVFGVTNSVTHLSQTPAANDTPYYVKVSSNDSALAEHIMGQMYLRVTDVTAGTVDSSWMFDVISNGAAGVNITGSLSSLGVWTDASSASNKFFEGDAMTMWPDFWDRLKKLRVERYRGINVKGDKVANAERHVSPSAEDFNAAFGVSSQTGIAPKDLAGVALIGLQDLVKRVEALESHRLKFGVTIPTTTLEVRP